MRCDFLTSTSLILIASLGCAAPAFAQDGEADSVSQADTSDPAAAGPGEVDDTNTILVIAGFLAGRVDAPEPPIEELDAEDIASYGAGSLTELMQALAPQTGSARGRGGGRPYFLVNGVRVSSFREMRSYPPEALEKVEILPEEVAQRYGFPANARVVNFILKDGFSSRDIELEYGQPGIGGNSTKQAEATYLRIDGPSRLNLNLEWSDTSLLTEAERDIIQTDAPDLASDPDPAQYRSLVADSSSLGFTGNWTTTLGQDGGSLGFNLTAEREDSLSFSGLDSVLLTDPDGNSVLRTFGASDPLKRRSRSDTLSAGANLSLPVGDWQLTATADAQFGDTSTQTDRRADVSGLVADATAGLLTLDAALDGLVADPGFDDASSKTYTIDTLATVRGKAFYLPAGDVSLTLDAGFKANGIDSEDTRNPGLKTSLNRSRVSGGINIALPLTSRDEDFGGAIGDITLNLNGGIDHLSDFGTLSDWSVSINWGITDNLNLTATRLSRDEAPSLTQLGAPELVTPNVAVFDIANGETVLAEITSGGNPNLIAENQKDWNFGAAWELPFIDDARIQVNYIRNSSENVSSSFPTLTPAIEAAFPDRVTRDASNRLIALDRRPITLAQQKSSRLQFGFNLSGRISGSQDAEQGGGASQGGPRGPGAGGGPQGGPPGDRGGVRGGPQGGPGGFGGPPGGPGGGQRPNFDPERFAAIRARLCVDGGLDAMIAMIENGGDGDAQIPDEFLQRFRNENGEVDRDRVERFHTRICSMDGPPGAAGAAQGAGQGSAQTRPQGGGAGGGAPRGGFRGFGRGGQNGGRWFININHTIELDNTVLIAPGVAELDLLDGDALSGGGVSRHNTQLVGGVFYNGMGVRVSGRYTGSSRIDGSGLPGSSDLYFSDFATLDARFFVDLGRQEKLVAKMPFFKNVRVSFDVENVFDARQRVTDANGDVPLSYQPFLIDPIGRSFEFELRKLF